MPETTGEQTTGEEEVGFNSLCRAWSLTLPPRSTATHVGPDGTTFVLLDEGAYVVFAVDEDGTPLWQYEVPDLPNGYIDVAAGAAGLDDGDFVIRLTHVQSATGVASSLIRFDPSKQRPEWSLLLDTGIESSRSLQQLEAGAPDLLVGAGITGGPNRNLYLLGLDPLDGGVLWSNRTESDLTNNFVMGLSVHPDFGILVAYGSISSSLGVSLLRFDLDGTLVGGLAHPGLAAVESRHARVALDRQGNPILAYFTEDATNETNVVIERRDADFAPLASSSVAITGSPSYMLTPIASADDDDAIVAWTNTASETSIIRVSPDGQEITNVDPGLARKAIRMAAAPDGGLRLSSQKNPTGPIELARYDGCDTEIRP